jgi:hypothetical protein
LQLNDSLELDAAAAEVELLGRTAIGRELVDVDALARLEGLGFERALAVQALLQVRHVTAVRSKISLAHD